MQLGCKESRDCRIGRKSQKRKELENARSQKQQNNEKRKKGILQNVLASCAEPREGSSMRELEKSWRGGRRTQKCRELGMSQERINRNGRKRTYDDRMQEPRNRSRKRKQIEGAMNVKEA